MDDVALVPVEHQPDFENVALVPVDHDPFSANGVTQQAQFQQPQAQTQPAPQTQPQQEPVGSLSMGRRGATSPADRAAAVTAAMQEVV